MGKDIGYWIFQAKNLTFAELEEKTQAPIRHWCNDHSLCGDWCYSKKVVSEGKVDNQKSLFDVSNADDLKAIEQIREVQRRFTTHEKLIQVHHPYSTQLNESLNMRIAEVAPKHKNFSRTRSLEYRICHGVCIHNDSLPTFMSHLHRSLGITPSSVYLKWVQKRETWHNEKKVRDKLPENKRKRAHKQEARSKEVIYLERTQDIKDGTYASGVSCNADPKNTKKKNDKSGSDGKRKRNRAACTCGEGGVHYSSLYKLCGRNPKNKRKKTEAEATKNQNENVTSCIANTITDTTKLT